MKTLYFDCFSGISGDMTLGALVDIGVPAEYLKKELNKLHIDDEFSLTFDTTQKMGITGTKAGVALHNQAPHEDAHGHVHQQEEGHSHQQEEGHHHDHHGGHHHSHDHHEDHIHHEDEHGRVHQQEEGHSHQQEEGHDHHKSHSHEHRNLHSISHIIERSGITPRAKEWALKIFTKVAEAEAKVHGKPIDEVHFHEVGATDSIVDIVGAAVGLDYLNVDKIMASSIEVGGGFVKCAHGLFPVPAPATIEILTGIPCTYGKVDSETTTPTGAAILAAMVDEFTTSPSLSVDKIGYGLGFKDFEIPNVLRVMLGESESLEETDYERDQNQLIECNLDDMNAEDYQNIMDKLLEAGALDVYMTSIMMKKARPAVKLSVLVKQSGGDACLSILFKHSTTFGVRITEVEKLMLKREIKIIETSYGPVQVKVEQKGNSAGKWKMEYEDLKALAEKNDMSLPALRAKLMEEIAKAL